MHNFQWKFPFFLDVKFSSNIQRLFVPKLIYFDRFTQLLSSFKDSKDSINNHLPVTTEVPLQNVEIMDFSSNNREKSGRCLIEMHGSKFFFVRTLQNLCSSHVFFGKEITERRLRT